MLAPGKISENNMLGAEICLLPLKVHLILQCREIMLSAVDTHCPVWMPCETVNTSLTGISCYCQHRHFSPLTHYKLY